MRFKILATSMIAISLISLSSCTFEEEKFGNVYLANNGQFEYGEVTLSESGKVEVGTLIKVEVNPLPTYVCENITLNGNILDSNEFYAIEGDNKVDVRFIKEKEDPITPPVEDHKEPIELDLPKGQIVAGSGAVIFDPKYKLISQEEYYKNIDFKGSVDTLKKELKILLDTMTVFNYGDSRHIMIYADEATEESGKILGFYDSKLLKPVWDQGSTWNREHVWARNHLQIGGQKPSTNNSYKGVGSDLHNLRPTSVSVNSARGDKYFDNSAAADYFFPNQKGNHDFRGDVARTIFYMGLKYDGLIVSDNPNSQSSVSMGKLSVLLEWNILDPVDEYELRRNNRIYEYQGNRNPFVDYPYTLADKIYK